MSCINSFLRYRKKIVPIQAYLPVRSLEPGARVALVAPAGPLRGQTDVDLAVQNVRSFGWEAVVGAHVLEHEGYLAGSDAVRLADLNSALCDDTIDAIWCIRGGYGVTRILDGVAYDALRVRPKAVIGYSDITALHAAIGQVCGIVSYHAPTARATLTSFSRDSFTRALVTRGDSGGVADHARTLRGGVAHGRLAGGNLALIAALAGTPYFPNLDGAILILEDVNEAVYRMDRMLRQLLMTGALAHVAAIAFGQSTDVPAAVASDTEPFAPDHTTRTLDTVLREVAATLNIPCVTGLPIGHVDDQWTIPLGALATLDADARTLHIENI